MIIIKKLLYLKYFTIFILLEVLISFIMAIFNLISISPSITSIMILIINIAIFLVYGYKFGKVSKKKGYIVGLIIGLILNLILFISNLIFFSFNFKSSSIFYYFSLLIFSIIGSIIGKNKKK